MHAGLRLVHKRPLLRHALAEHLHASQAVISEGDTSQGRHLTRPTPHKADTSEGEGGKRVHSMHSAPCTPLHALARLVQREVAVQLVVLAAVAPLMDRREPQLLLRVGSGDCRLASEVRCSWSASACVALSCASSICCRCSAGLSSLPCATAVGNASGGLLTTIRPFVRALYAKLDEAREPEAQNDGHFTRCRR